MASTIEIEEAPETPISSAPCCLRTCGTMHRGCDPQCPKRWYEVGLDRGYAMAFDRVRAYMAEEHSP